jgi:hypothetical protein
MEHFALGYNEKSGFSRATELPARRKQNKKDKQSQKYTIPKFAVAKQTLLELHFPALTK